MKREDFMKQSADEMTISELANAIRIKHKKIYVKIVEEKKSLSDKREWSLASGVENGEYKEEDVKEFIKDIKEEIKRKSQDHTIYMKDVEDFILEMIDRKAGKRLT